MLDLSGDLAGAFFLNYGKICHGCRFLQFTLIEHVFNMLKDDGFIALEEIGDLTGRKPYGLADEANVDAGLAVLGLEKDDVAGVVYCDVWSARMCGVGPGSDLPEEREEDPAEF